MRALAILTLASIAFVLILILVQDISGEDMAIPGAVMVVVVLVLSALLAGAALDVTKRR